MKASNKTICNKSWTHRDLFEAFIHKRENFYSSRIISYSKNDNEPPPKKFKTEVTQPKNDIDIQSTASTLIFDSQESVPNWSTQSANSQKEQ